MLRKRVMKKEQKQIERCAVHLAQKKKFERSHFCESCLVHLDLCRCRVHMQASGTWELGSAHLRAVMERHSLNLVLLRRHADERETKSRKEHILLSRD